MLVVVTGYTGSNPNPRVRLIASSGGIGYSEGRVQVRYNNTWKSICDNQWGVLDVLMGVSR